MWSTKRSTTRWPSRRISSESSVRRFSGTITNEIRYDRAERVPRETFDVNRRRDQCEYVGERSGGRLREGRVSLRYVQARATEPGRSDRTGEGLLRGDGHPSQRADVQPGSRAA